MRKMPWCLSFITMAAPRPGNVERAVWRKKCRQQLSQHIGRSALSSIVGELH